MNDLHGYYFEDLSVGMEGAYAKTITDADIILFAGISGDDNPLHINAEFAATTRFKKRIAHGLLSASFISTVLGTRLPGPGAIFLSLNVRFKSPVYSGDTVQAAVKIKEIVLEKRRIIFETICSVNGNNVLEGEAVMMVDSRAQESAHIKSTDHWRKNAA